MVIKYYSESEEYKANYVFSFLSHLFLIKFVPANKCNAQIVHSTNEAEKHVLWIKFSKKDLVWENLINNLTSRSNKVEFDIISAIFMFLTDKVNNTEVNENIDQHGRLMFHKSFQFKNNIHKIPIVNIYVNHIKNVIENYFNVKIPNFLPNDKKGCILLTHDIDIPVKYGELFFKPLTFNLSEFIIKLKSFGKYLLDKDRNEFWNFEKVYEKEKSYNFKSTSFFCTSNRWDKKSSKYDVTYSIRNKRFKKLLKKIELLNFGIGLHTSYNSITRNSIKTEFKILNSYVKVIGNRHHFWNYGKSFEKAAKIHYESGIKYDSSISFNDNIGYRFNCALPFFPFDQEKKEIIKVLQIPNLCMDSHLLIKKNRSEEEIIDELFSHIETLKQNKGIASLDWHIRTSFPNKTYYKWGRVYYKILEKLSKDSSLWVTNCEDLYYWYISRLNNFDKFS
jgi:hypothetical protein